MKTELTKSEFWRIEGVEWKEITLKDLVEKSKGIQRGPWGGQIKKEIFVKSGYPVYEQGNVIKNNFTHFRYFLTQEKFNEFKNYHVIPGDFLITSAGTMGIIREIPDFAPIGSINQALIRIRINKNKITSEYFLLHFNYLIERVKDEYSKGSAMKNLVSVKVIELLPFIIPYRNGKPDLETQKKIVEYIETSFSKLDSILEKKKIILSQLDELWESILENAFKPREGEEWRAVKLGEIIIDKPRYGLTAKSKNKGKYLYLRITDINDKGEINEDGFKFVDLDKKEKSKYEIKKGDLLLARSGSVGNFFIADKDYPDWVYASYLIRFRLDSNKILPSFIKHVLISRKFKRWVEYQKRTGAQPNINAKEYSSFKFPLPFHNGKPDLERQKEIADYLDMAYEKLKIIKEKVKSQISQLDEMKESILNEVFSHDKVK